MLVSSSILTALIISLVILGFDWRIGLILIAGLVLFLVVTYLLFENSNEIAPLKINSDEEQVNEIIEYVEGINKDLVEAISPLTKNETITMIAHPLKAVRNADQILVIENGKLTEIDRHKELIKQDGLYKRFIEVR